MSTDNGLSAVSLMRPGLRLVTADEFESGATNSRGLSPDMTLGEFAEAFVLAVWLLERKASPQTIGLYRESLAYWARFAPEPGEREPSLFAIDDFHTSRFLQGLYALPGRAPRGVEKPISAYTVRKHVRNVQTCLSLAGPKTSAHRKAQRLIEEVPFLEPPQVDAGEVDDNFTLDEIAQILDGCRFMRRPKIRGVPPPHYWRSLAIVAYNTAERRYALLHVPQPKVGAAELVFPRSVRKGRVRANRVPLNEWARAAIEEIRTDRELLFPWPSAATEDEGMRNFSRHWERLLRLSGIPEERRFGLHGLRKATGTEMGADSPMGAMLTLGHQQWTTFQRHYAGKKIKADALEKLPQPARARRRPDDDPAQRLLF